MTNDIAAIGTREIVRRLEERARVELHWNNSVDDDLPSIRIAGPERDRGIAMVLSRRRFTVTAELVPEPYAGALLRVIGDQVTADPERWRGLLEESRQRGQRLAMYVNGEFCNDVDALPSDPWRSLEFEASVRLAHFRGGVEAATEDVLSTCLSLVLAGFDVDPEEAEDDDPLGGLEGASRRVIATRYERNRANRMRCIRHYGTTCWVCDFDFAATYGATGDGIIVVHHVVPVSQLGPGYRVDPIRDLIPLCDNCHHIVHTEDPPTLPEVLRGQLGLPPKPPRGD